MIPVLAMDRPATAMTSTYAHADFRRARRRHLTARVRRWLRPTRPRDLAHAVSLHWQPGRRRAIPVEAIVGTVDATPDFDASFRPATERVAPRWLSIARAHHDGRQLPPIDVIELTDGYYVIDGRHRVSVARALGHAEIEAHTSRGASVRGVVGVVHEDREQQPPVARAAARGFGSDPRVRAAIQARQRLAPCAVCRR